MSPSQVAPPSTTSPSHRSGRLRGLSYLRHYTHGHNHGTSLPAAPTVTPTNASSNSTHHPNVFSHIAPPVPSSSPPTSAQLPRQSSTSPLNNTASNAWLPTVSGISGLSRVASLPSAELSNTPGVVSNGLSGVRSSDSAAAGSSGSATSNPLDFTSTHGPANPPLVQSPSKNARVAQTNELAASIRFIPHIDQRASRESLIFPPIERALRFKDERIRVGRYSDRDSSNPSAPVGFKSKVVSRRHCEFWCDGGQWYVKDVKSSSGTFLNHIRLSAPGMESKAYPLYDGDILQLGIDFKGGEEQIFRCVKIRVELNRAWQKSLNNFKYVDRLSVLEDWDRWEGSGFFGGNDRADLGNSMSAHRRLRNLAKSNPSGAKAKDGDACSTHTSECSICLMPVAPCQSLFVAPCSHVWHYKCIRPLVEKEYPTFLCPNCRAIADLERDIEEDELGEGWEAFDDEQGEELVPAIAAVKEAAVEPIHDASGESLERALEQPTTPTVDIAHPLIDQQPSDPVLDPTPAITTSPVEIRQTSSSRTTGSWRRRNERVRDLDLQQEGGGAEECESSSSSSSTGGEGGGNEGPMTPMNDAGPFVFDGVLLGLEGGEDVAMMGDRAGEGMGDETRIVVGEVQA